jgi:hydrogenase nickel incorporation protein HypA/HybF
MHEWALAEGIILTASQIAKKEGIKEIKEVQIKVGEFQQIELEIFEFALLQLKTNIFKNAKFSIKTTKAELKCKVCKNLWYFNKEKFERDVLEAIHFIPETAHAYIQCPKCKSYDFEISQGRGVWLERLKGE